MTTPPEARTGSQHANQFLAAERPEWIDGLTGTDMVSYYYAPRPVTVDLAARVPVVDDPATPADETATAPAYNKYTGAGSRSWAEGDRYVNIENVDGSDWADIIFGNAEANRLRGRIGDDTISGRQGNDTVNGARGNDKLHGGAGNDTLLGGAGLDKLAGASGADTLNGGEGMDWAQYGGSKQGVTVSLVAGAANTGGHAQGDVLIDIEYLRGSRHADSLTGNGEANRIMGGAGADTINGGDGRDKIEGEAGADTLDGGDDRDWANYRKSDAGVTVSLVAGATNTGGHAQGDVLRNMENLRGSQHADSLIGDASDNRLHGGGGADTLAGGGGSDVFIFHTTNLGGATITDFELGTDTIRIKPYGIVYGDNLTIGDSGEDTVITLDRGDGITSTLTLTGIDHTALEQDDFHITNADGSFLLGEFG
ncbi:MAG: hypothetical protein GDA53_05795 [Rhodobacteraceae bacterium]|nr:hypothetical protein [Paracoccaceae bacterium]